MKKWNPSHVLVFQPIDICLTVELMYQTNVTFEFLKLTKVAQEVDNNNIPRGASLDLY